MSVPPFDKTKDPDFVYHYTTIAGCYGILSSNVLHASNIRFVNDRKELRFVDEFIRDSVKAKFVSVFSDARKKAILNQPVDIDMLSDAEANTLISQIHITSERIAPVFAVSFCRSWSDETEHNGLLSQWRGYGVEGGVALRFRVNGLKELLRSEVDKFNLMANSLGDVIYGRQDVEFDSIKDDLDVFPKVVPDIVEGILKNSGIDYQYEGDKVSLDSLWKPYANVAPRLKHPGFSEEAEYRMVVAAWKGHPDPETKKEKKPVFFKIRNNYILPYLVFNDRENVTLPIDRILVGPSLDAERRRDGIDAFVRELAVDIAVDVSNIPFA